MQGSNYSGRKYEVVNYDPTWVAWYEREAQIIREIVKEDIQDIQHVGSTSVPQMAGKPLIDMLVLVHDISYVDRHTAEMEEAGYIALGGYLSTDSRLFEREKDGYRLVNVHVMTTGNPLAVEMLAVRNYLRTYPDEVAKYSQLKRELYAGCSGDYATYRREKDIYVEQLNKRALKWAEVV